jgi:hypothetical protein
MSPKVESSKEDELITRVTIPEAAILVVLDKT